MDLNQNPRIQHRIRTIINRGKITHDGGLIKILHLEDSELIIDLWNLDWNAISYAPPITIVYYHDEGPYAYKNPLKFSHFDIGTLTLLGLRFPDLRNDCRKQLKWQKEHPYAPNKRASCR
jgi:hypothetical protein